jgi:hypothetical protein
MHRKMKKVRISPETNRPKPAPSRNISVIALIFENKCFSLADRAIEIRVIIPRRTEKNQESELIWNTRRDSYDLVKIRKSIFKF